MSCPQCQGIEELFSQQVAESELAAYRRKGPNGTTRMLLDDIQAYAAQDGGLQGLTLLDIGGGVGAIQHTLLAAGASQAMDVDASRAYLNAARKEAEVRGLASRLSFRHGNFVDLAPEIPPSDIVTLDRVICCYPEVEKLVSLSAARARKFYGVVYPRDTWWMRLGLAIGNLYFRIRRNTFRGFVHPTRRVEALIAEQGLVRRSHRQTWIWQIAVFVR